MANPPPKKTVLVTGCSQDSLGEALALEFHRRNYTVIATARTLSRLTTLSSLGIKTRELDLTSSSSIATLANSIPHLDILFNNAGGNLVMPFADTTPAQFREMFNLNVFGTYELTQLLLPQLVASKGIIVNHTSQCAHALKAPASAYAAAKAALACLTDAMRVELQPLGVNVVEVVTGMAQSNITKFEKQFILPRGSFYESIREGLERCMSGKDADGYQMKADVWARKVVGDLLDGWFGTPKWIWRGAFASTMYVIVWMEMFWKGCTDPMFRAMMGMSGLKKQLEEEKKRA